MPARVLSKDDARFFGWLALVFGVLFILGGRLAAFTLVGAALMFAGSAMLLASPFLLGSLRVGLVSLALLVVTWVLPLSVVG